MSIVFVLTIAEVFCYEQREQLVLYFWDIESWKLPRIAQRKKFPSSCWTIGSLQAHRNLASPFLTKPFLEFPWINSVSPPFSYFQIAGTPQVKTQVKLKFRDVTGNIATIDRKMMLTQKKSTVTQKTIDTTLTSKNSQTGVVNFIMGEKELERRGVLSVILAPFWFLHFFWYFM